jgi:hypothetical protein
MVARPYHVAKRDTLVRGEVVAQRVVVGREQRATLRHTREVPHHSVRDGVAVECGRTAAWAAIDVNE